MWRDEVLEEIYKIREEHAKAFNYDLSAICDDLRQRQALSTRRIIAQPLKQSQKRHNKPLELDYLLNRKNPTP
jgi:hypothetical protein